VIPAKAGIHSIQLVIETWTPAFVGVTIFCECINIYVLMKLL